MEYHLRNEEMQLLRFLTLKIEGVKAVFIEGLPGVGKTYFGEWLAETNGWKHLFYLCHSWTSDQELFRGIDPVAAVTGDVDNIQEDGILLAAAKESQNGKVVLVLDEIDKAPERVDGLLLDFLQNGRVPCGKGQMCQANRDNLIVLITSNAVREPHPALLRRCRRLKMRQLPNDVFDSIVMEKSRVSKTTAHHSRVLFTTVMREDGQDVSVQEVVNFGIELSTVTNMDDLLCAVEGWAVRGDKGRKFLQTSEGQAALGRLFKLL